MMLWHWEKIWDKRPNIHDRIVGCIGEGRAGWGTYKLHQYGKQELGRSDKVQDTLQKSANVSAEMIRMLPGWGSSNVPGFTGIDIFIEVHGTPEFGCPSVPEKDGRKGTSVIDIPQRTQKTQSWEEVNYLQTTNPRPQRKRGQCQYHPPPPEEGAIPVLSTSATKHTGLRCYYTAYFLLLNI